MLSLLGSALSTSAMVSLGGVDLEALFMYGLVAFVIGMIAWSKYNEPSESNPYPQERSGHALAETAGHADLEPVVAVPVVGTPVAARERP